MHTPYRAGHLSEPSELLNWVDKARAAAPCEMQSIFCLAPPETAQQVGRGKKGVEGGKTKGYARQSSVCVQCMCLPPPARLGCKLKHKLSS